jgi:hypothetical protein
MHSPILINLSKKHLLRESSLAKFAVDLKILLRNILSPAAYGALIREEDDEEKPQPQFVIKGSKEDVDAFAATIEKEKQYALNYMEHGLGSEKVSDAKLDLEKSIHNFEKTTGIKWPIG